AIAGKIGGLGFDELVGIQAGKRGNQGSHRILVGAQRLGIDDLPFAVIAFAQKRSFSAGLLDADLPDLVLGNIQDFGSGLGGWFGGFGLLPAVGPVKRPAE